MNLDGVSRIVYERVLMHREAASEQLCMKFQRTKKKKIVVCSEEVTRVFVCRFWR
jgi:hypothetical protein